MAQINESETFSELVHILKEHKKVSQKYIKKVLISNDEKELKKCYEAVMTYTKPEEYKPDDFGYKRKCKGFYVAFLKNQEHEEFQRGLTPHLKDKMKDGVFPSWLKNIEVTSETLENELEMNKKFLALPEEEQERLVVERSNKIVQLNTIIHNTKFSKKNPAKVMAILREFESLYGQQIYEKETWAVYSFKHNMEMLVAKENEYSLNHNRSTYKLCFNKKVFLIGENGLMFSSHQFHSFEECLSYKYKIKCVASVLYDYSKSVGEEISYEDEWL